MNHEFEHALSATGIPELGVLEAKAGFKICFLRFGEWQERVKLIDPGYPPAQNDYPAYLKNTDLKVGWSCKSHWLGPEDRPKYTTQAAFCFAGLAVRTDRKVCVFHFLPVQSKEVPKILEPDLSQIIGGIVGWGVPSTLAAGGKKFLKNLGFTEIVSPTGACFNILVDPQSREIFMAFGE